MQQLLSQNTSSKTKQEEANRRAHFLLNGVQNEYVDPMVAYNRIVEEKEAADVAGANFVVVAEET